MNSIANYIHLITQNPESVSFQETIEVIEANYNFVPTAFKNGNLINNAGENNGSCKIFSFAKANQLSKEITLALFGKFYFEDVLLNPNASDHQNIRNFMKFGWEGISIETDALKMR
jgi:hypothetical protein